MTAKISASADGLKVTIGNSAEDALEINQTAKTIKGINGYSMASDKVAKAGDTMTGQLKGITPVAADDLTRKDYVDGKISRSGDTMTGLLALAASGVRFNDLTIQQTAVVSAPLSDRGSFQLPGGVRGQYGSAVITFDASGNGNLPYNSAFPNTAFLVAALSGDAGAAQSVTFSVLSSNLSGVVLRCIIVNPYSVFQGAARVNWLALGS